MSKNHEYTGDDFLSSVDLQPWRLVQEVLMRWSTLIIFTHQRTHVPKGIPTYFMFFVPKNATFRYEIVKFLEYETESWKQDVIPCKPEDKESGVDYDWPGTKVSVDVTTFRGVDPHLDRDVRDKMIQEALKDIKMRFKKQENDDKQEEK